jgi:hypothetical protein
MPITKYTSNVISPAADFVGALFPSPIGAPLHPLLNYTAVYRYPKCAETPWLTKQALQSIGLCSSYAAFSTAHVHSDLWLIRIWSKSN